MTLSVEVAPTVTTVTVTADNAVDVKINENLFTSTITIAPGKTGNPYNNSKDGQRALDITHGDIYMNSEYDASAGLRSSARLIFNDVDNPWIQNDDADNTDTTLTGFTSGVGFVTATGSTTTGNAMVIQGGVESDGDVSGNISQLGDGELVISAGKLVFRGKREIETGSGTNKFRHTSNIALTVDHSDDPHGANVQVAQLYYGINSSLTQKRNIRLVPSNSGIIVEGMGDATTTTTTKTNTGTIGVFNDTDLLTLSQNQATVAGNLTATTIVASPGSQPGSPIEGQIYYDSTANKLKFYNGSAFETITSST